MRFAALRLIRYGRFEACDLVFKAGEIDLQLILGPNEAGKSTTLAAVSDLLFEFKPRTRFAFRFDQTALRVGAAIEADGKTFEIRRKKGKLNTLLTANDEPADQALLVPLLAGQTRETYERMFSLDHERLREGGKLMLDSKDDFGAALFAAGSGLTHVVQACERLEEEAKALWGRTAGDGRPLNKALSDYQAGRQTLKEVEVRPAAWGKARRHLHQIEKELEGLKAGRADLFRQQRLLQRQQLVLGPLVARARAQSRLAELGDLPDLPGDLPERLEAALDSARNAKLEIALAIQDLDRLGLELVEDRPVAAVLAVAEDVEGLRELKAVVDLAAAGLPAAAAELEVVSARVRTAAAELGWDGQSIEALRAKLPGVAALEEIKALIGRRSGIDEQVRLARETEAEAKASVEKLTQQIAFLPANVDVGPLHDLLRAYRSAGLTTAREEAGRALDELRAHLEAGLRELAPWAGDVMALRSLRLPASEDAAKALAAIDAATGELTAASEACERERTRSEHLELERKQVMQSHATPDLRELEAVRVARSDLWSPIRRHLLGEQPLSAPGEGVEAFEGALADADRVADERFAGAERAGGLAALEREIEKAALKAEQTDRLRREAQDRLSAARAAFEALIEDCGVPLSAASFVNWHDARLDALEKAAGADLAQAAVERARTAEAAAARELKRALGHAEDAEASLAELLARGERAVEAATEARTRSRELHARLDAAEEGLVTAARQTGRAATADREWSEAWAAALQSAGLPAGSGVAGARALTDLVEQLRVDVQDQLARQAALEAARASVADFERQVAEVACRAGLADAGGVAATYAAIQAAVATATRKAQREQETSNQIEQASVRKAGREETLALAEALLEPLIQAAPDREEASLRAVLARAREAVRLMEEIARSETAILGHGDGHTLETLIEESSAADADALAEQAAQIAEALGVLGPEIDEKSEARSAADLTFRALNDGPDAAIANFAIAEARSEVAFQAEQYIRKRAEARLLRTLIERYRHEKQGPLLTRASALFTTLTLGAFTRLTVDYEDDAPKLKGVRTEDAPYVGLDGMSEGTVDQLYLALRIAAVEEAITQGVRLPFLADDLFINFDEERAAAGFRVLGELARKTQVLFFTHHTHLAKLADDALGPGSASLCGLDGDVLAAPEADFSNVA